MKFFVWLDKNKSNDKGYILFLKLMYRVFSNSIIVSIANVAIPFVFSLPIFINNNNCLKWGIPCLVLLFLLNVVGCISEKYKSHLSQMGKGYSEIVENVQSIYKVYNERITDYNSDEVKSTGLKFNELFKVISNSVCSDIYHFFKDVFQIETRISLIQQYKENETGDFNNSVMISRTSSKTQNLGKVRDDSVVKYDGNNKHKYYNKILLDNNDSTVVLLESEIKNSFYVEPAKKQCRETIYQYIGIPQKAYGKEIAFLLQIDVMEKDGFGKTKEDIEAFCNKYIDPFVSILQNAYLVETIEQI